MGPSKNVRAFGSLNAGLDWYLGAAERRSLRPGQVLHHADELDAHYVNSDGVSDCALRKQQLEGIGAADRVDHAH